MVKSAATASFFSATGNLAYTSAQCSLAIWSLHPAGTKEVCQEQVPSWEGPLHVLLATSCSTQVIVFDSHPPFFGKQSHLLALCFMWVYSSKRTESSCVHHHKTPADVHERCRPSSWLWLPESHRPQSLHQDAIQTSNSKASFSRTPASLCWLYSRLCPRQVSVLHTRASSSLLLFRKAAWSLLLCFTLTLV